MNRLKLFAAAAALLTCSGAHAQYYGLPFYTEGFENEAALSNWTINTSVEPTVSGSQIWYLGDSDFNELDATSTKSLRFKLAKEDLVNTTITSPVIDATGKHSLYAGAFAENAFSSNNYAWHGVTAYFQVKAEGEDEWETLYTSPASCYSTSVWGWNEARSLLPSKYDGQKFRLRLCIICNRDGGAAMAKDFSFDGIYVAENYSKDAAVTNIQPSGNIATTAPVPITLTVQNKGGDPISNFMLSYRINNGAPVMQNADITIAPGESADITFDTKADLSEFGKEYTIFGIVMVPEDAVSTNNSMEIKVPNILTSLPYEAPALSRTSTDYWDAPDEGDDCNGSWSVYVDRTAGNHWSMTAYGNKANNCRLYSRPIYMTAGQNVSASFKFWGKSSGDDCTLEVYYVKYDDRYDISKCHLIETYTVNAETVTKKISFTVPEDGAYAVMFYNKPVAGGKVTGLNSFKIAETPAYDANVVSIDSPSFTKDEYTASETVKVTVSNVGLQPVEGAKLRLTVDGNVAATEDLPVIPVAESIQYTFNYKPDLSAGQKHTMNVELIWEQDVDSSNNSAAATFTADLVSPPYTVSLYTNDYKTHWSWKDNNSDGNTFEYEEVYGNTRISYNVSNATIPTTDETLFARTLRMEAGKTYKLTGRVSIWGNSDGSVATFNCAMDLYKVDTEGNRTFVKNIDTAEYESTDGNYTLGFNVPENGKYCVAFHLTKDSETATKCCFQDMTIEESGDIELILSTVKVPGTVISGYKTLPYSIQVTNNGLKTIESTTLKISSETLGTISETITFADGLKPGKYASVAVENPLVMNITGEEVVTFEIDEEDDVVPSNNVKTVILNYLPTLDIPFTQAINNQGFLALDNNGDCKAPSYASYYGSFDMSEGTPGDWVMSPTFNAVKDTPYHITYSARLSGYPVSGRIIDVFALNIEDNTKTPCGSIVFDKENTPGGYYNFDMESFLTLDKDGVYALVFEMIDKLGASYPYMNIGGDLAITALEAAPDMKVTAITSPVADKTYEKDELEQVTATYKNAGTMTMLGVSFKLQAGENAYYRYIGNIEPGAEGTVEFNDVDLYTPGEYELAVTAEVGGDATPADNTATKTINSLYVYDANVLSIDGPDNGPLGAHEHVLVTVQNDGHGALVDTPITLTISSDVNPTPVVITETIPGPIAEGESCQYRFETESDFSEDATYSVSVSINLEGDINPDNNTFSGSIRSTHEDLDAGVSAIVDPTQRRMTNEEHIVIKVKNYTEIDLYRVPVEAVVSFNGEEVGRASGIVAEIPAGEDVEYTFPTAVDMMHGGEYTIKATTNMPNDVDTSNDSCEDTIYAFIKDCGVSRIISPEPSGVEGKQTITIEIKNHGDVPVSNIPVAFKLGSNPQIDTYEGELQPGETVEFSFKSQYNFRSGREYTLTAYTAHPEDENNDNDACEAIISPTSGIAGVYANGIGITAGQGKVIITTDSVEGSVTIIDAAGKCVASENISAHVTEINLLPGLYIVNVNSESARATTKVMVR